MIDGPPKIRVVTTGGRRFTGTPASAMAALRRLRRHLRALAAAYVAIAVALTGLLLVLEERLSERTGLRRQVFANTDFEGVPFVADVSPDISLDFLDDDPTLPRRFFSARWRGFWYVPESGAIDLHGAGDDRLDVWLDGELLIRRTPPAEMHTRTRTIDLDAGVHEVRVEYEQHGGGHVLRVLWAPQGGRPRPLPPRDLFHSRPGPDDLRLARDATRLRRMVFVAWGAPAVLGMVLLGGRELRRRARNAAIPQDRPRNSEGSEAASPPSSPPLPPGRRLARNAAFLALSALFCSNVFLLTDLDSHAILGGDPAAINWQLQWVSRALYTDPLNLFNGNTFHPHPNVIALMDHMLTLAVINVPLSLLSDSPWFGYNLLIFLAYYLSCVGGYWFMREVTGSRQAGVWAGIFWAFMFFRIHHIGHLNILSVQWMPFVACALIRFLRDPTRVRTLVLSVCFVAQALVSWYVAVITAILVAVLAVLHVGRRHLTRRHAAGFTAVLAFCAAVVVPTALPYRTSLEETNLGNRAAEALVPRDRVSISDYLEPPRATMLGQLRQDGPSIWGERTLYIGYVALTLALAGLAIRRAPRAAATADAPERATPASGRWLATGICLVVVGFVLAKGFISSQETRLPLFYLSEVPGLDFLKGLRATPRFSLLLYFGVMILSGAGVAALAARFRSPRTAWVVVALACLAFLAEVYPYRLPVEPRPYEVSRLDRAIPRLWGDERRAPVVLHLPIHYFLRDYATPEAVYMLDSTYHWARVVNGFSGAEPHAFRETMEALNALPDNRGVAALAELQVDLVAIHRATPPDVRRSLVAFFAAVPWATVHRVGEESLVRIDWTSIPAGARTTGSSRPAGS